MESFGFVPLFGQIQYWLLQIIEEPEAPPYGMESFGFVPFCTAKCIAANFISILSFAIMFLSNIQIEDSRYFAFFWMEVFFLSNNQNEIFLLPNIQNVVLRLSTFRWQNSCSK